MQDQILDMLVNEDEITWYSIIMDLIKTEKMDPWDIDISLLTHKYIDTIKKLKEANLSVSGKVLLASAILLRIKSKKLVEEDLMNLDRMMRFDDETEEMDEDDFEEQQKFDPKDMPKHYLLPRVPQPRKRKVSIYDLIDALQKALNVTKKRAVREILENVSVSLPSKKVDVNALINDVFDKVKVYYDSVPKEKNKNEDGILRFSKLIPSEKKEDMVHTFIPLLHLSNQRKVDLDQESAFSDFRVHMTDPKDFGKDIYGLYEKEQKKIVGVRTRKKKSTKKQNLDKNDLKELSDDDSVDLSEKVNENNVDGDNMTEENSDNKETKDNKEDKKEETPFISNMPPEMNIDENPGVMQEEMEAPSNVSEVFSSSEEMRNSIDEDSMINSNIDDDNEIKSSIVKESDDNYIE